MKEITDVVHRMTLTVSCPLDLFVWLKRSQRNCSAYVVQAVLEKRARDEEAGPVFKGDE
jgi:hypothetical protein